MDRQLQEQLPYWRGRSLAMTINPLADKPFGDDAGAPPLHEFSASVEFAQHIAAAMLRYAKQDGTAAFGCAINTRVLAVQIMLDTPLYGG
jgi:hypothetical protein